MRITALFCCALLASCGGRSKHDDAVAPDVACPAAQEPKLLFEPAADSAWAGKRRPFVIQLDGRDFLTSVALDANATSLELHDLTSGEDSTLEHAPGVTYCLGDPVFCIVREPGAFTLLQDLSLTGSEWTAASQRRYAVTGQPEAFPGDLEARRLPLWDEDASTLSRLDLDSGTLLYTLPLPSPLLDEVSDTQDRTIAIEVSQNSTSGNVVQSAPFTEGASFSPVYRGEPVKATALLLTPGPTRFAVRENGLADYRTTRVERVTDAAPTTLGTFADPPLTALDWSYRRHPLEAGSSMYALDCDTARQCRSFLIHLDPVTVELIGQAPWPAGSSAIVSGDRRLVCGGRDLILTTMDAEGETTQIWSVRLAGRRGAP